MEYKVELLFEIPCELGEGPMWHPDQHKLYWVDILQKKLHTYDVNNNAHKHFDFDKMPGAVVPSNIQDIVIISFEDGVAMFNTDKMELKYLLHYHDSLTNMRANDGKCDPYGNFWIGTMSKTCELDAGALYCFKPDQSFNQVIADCTISNGLAWDTSKNKMYYIDSIKDSIRSYDYDPLSFLLTNEKIIVHRPDLRYFDGMTIDNEGMLWVAHCMGSCIRRWHPDTGEELLKIDLPVPKVTSLTFGGDQMSTLYITTAQEHMNDDELKQYPLSGSVFQLKTDVKGRLTDRYILNSKNI